MAYPLSCATRYARLEVSGGCFTSAAKKRALRGIITERDSPIAAENYLLSLVRKGGPEGERAAQAYLKLTKRFGFTK